MAVAAATSVCLPSRVSEASTMKPAYVSGSNISTAPASSGGSDTFVVCALERTSQNAIGMSRAAIV